MGMQRHTSPLARENRARWAWASWASVTVHSCAAWSASDATLDGVACDAAADQTSGVVPDVASGGQCGEAALYPSPRTRHLSSSLRGGCAFAEHI